MLSNELPSLENGVSIFRDGVAFCCLAFDEYEAALAPARARFARAASIDRLLSAEMDNELLELFLLNYCSRGLRTTELVGGWIRRAGERCLDLGLEHLGRTLLAHVRHEEDHHTLMIADTYSLAARINPRRRAPIDADELLNAPPTPGAARYRKLHEDVIAGAAPFGQVAIEYEISRVAVTAVPALLARCADRLGRDILESLSFLTEHAVVDVGHTHLNVRELSRLLDEHPYFLPYLIEAGEGALAAYAEFMSDCLRAAETQVEVQKEVRA